MTDSTKTGTSARRPHPQRAPRTPNPGQPRPPQTRHPLLTELAGLYPDLFGAQPRPLKRGIYQDLLAAHPATLAPEGLKAALSEHTRSGAYLNAVASGAQRHNLEGQPVEPMATEHVVHALLEVFRRRQNRSPQDLSGQLVQRLASVFANSGLSREAFAVLAPARHPKAQAWFDAALETAANQTAKRVALRRAFDQSGLTLEAFAAQYGLHPSEAQHVLALDTTQPH